MDIEQAKQWINAMLYTALRRGDASVRFERDVKSGNVVSYGHDRHFLGALLCQDWHGFAKAVMERRSATKSGHLRKGPPEKSQPMFGKAFILCTLDRESYIRELRQRDTVARTG